MTGREAGHHEVGSLGSRNQTKELLRETAQEGKWGGSRKRLGEPSELHAGFRQGEDSGGRREEHMEASLATAELGSARPSQRA